MSTQHFVELLFDSEQRIKRLLAVLEQVRQLRPTQPVHLLAPSMGDIDAFEHNRAALNGSRRRKQMRDRPQ